VQETCRNKNAITSLYTKQIHYFKTKLTSEVLHFVTKSMATQREHQHVIIHAIKNKHYITYINRMRVLENRVLRSFGLKRNEVIGKQKRLHNEEFYCLY
jgi:hypothetical protein